MCASVLSPERTFRLERSLHWKRSAASVIPSRPERDEMFDPSLHGTYEAPTRYPASVSHLRSPRRRRRHPPAANHDHPDAATGGPAGGESAPERRPCRTRFPSGTACPLSSDTDFGLQGSRVPSKQSEPGRVRLPERPWLSIGARPRSSEAGACGFVYSPGTTPDARVGPAARRFDSANGGRSFLPGLPGRDGRRRLFGFAWFHGGWGRLAANAPGCLVARW